MTNPHDEIARVAYELYEKSGKVNGNDLFHWLEAERLIEAWHNDQKAGQEFGTAGKAAAAPQNYKKKGSRSRSAQATPYA